MYDNPSFYINFTSLINNLFYQELSTVILHTIAVTSKWAQLRLKSPASRLFIQPFIQT